MCDNTCRNGMNSYRIELRYPCKECYISKNSTWLDEIIPLEMNDYDNLYINYIQQNIYTLIKYLRSEAQKLKMDVDVDLKPSREYNVIYNYIPYGTKSIFNDKEIIK